MTSSSATADATNLVLPPENARPTTSKNMSSGPMAVAKFLIGTFSTSIRQRDPPANNNKTTHVRLITISVSHFCEKVRWALDHLEAFDDNPYYYTEDGHPPGFQAYETLAASNEEASITPMIVWNDNNDNDNDKDAAPNVLYDSTKILKQFWPELYPKEIESEIDTFEADLGKRLGSAVRCFAYYHILAVDLNQEKHEMFIDMVADVKRVSKVERKVADKFLDKGLAKGILKALEIDEKGAEASLQTMRDIFEDVSKRLENDGNNVEYIMDAGRTSKYGFTAADLTFAALAYPFLKPPEMSAWYVEESRQPKAIQDLTKELRATTAGKHVLKMYSKHRLTNTEETVVTPKVAGRNKYPWERK